MADPFDFVNTDLIVTTYLTQGERANIAVWQVSGEYHFEFHNGHPTGRPIYIRPDGNTEGANIPKFDTLNRTAANYNAITKFANGTKLRDALSNGAQAEILNIIANNWAVLSLLATRWWTNTIPPPPVPVIAAPVNRACTMANCAGRVPIYANNGRAMCDTCFTWQ